MRDRAAAVAAVERARAWIAANALILDTETTGLDDDAEVVELAVIDCAGTVLLDTLVRPSGPVPAEAAAIHGITDAMLADAPTWSEIHDRFCDLVEGRQVVIYSREFDARVISQTARRYGLQAPQCFDLASDDSAPCIARCRPMPSSTASGARRRGGIAGRSSRRRRSSRA